MTADLGSHLFTFAVVSDSHVNEGEDRSVSPFASNRLANARFRWVVAEVAGRRPAFTVHLGDMANPLPELATYRQAAANFKEIAAALPGSLHLVPGNHCLGDKPTGWVPVPRVSPESLELYAEVYGRDYYSFDHGPCHFMALDSLLINSGLEQEDAQRRWLERDLEAARAAGQRLFLLMHYPAFVAAPEEPGGYDNLDQPGRTWLLDLIERHGVEAAFSGHVHNYFYNRYGPTRLYTLPATSFVRQDYGELFTVEPADAEGGRDDRSKLGYCLVEVYERGHLHRVVRTEGRTLAPGESPSSAGDGSLRPAAGAAAPVGVEMRENWLATLALRANNSVSPFTRRWARNDWALLALEEMGVGRVRIALQELVRDDVVERMATLVDAGYAFTAYSYGLPGAADYRLIRSHRGLLAGWELVLRLDQVEALAAGLAGAGPRLSGGAKLPLFLSEVRDPLCGAVDDANVKHEANYGFQAGEPERIERLQAAAPVREIFAGLVFRVRRHGGVGPWAAVGRIGEWAAASGLRHQAQVLFSGRLTSDRLVDDLAAANRVAEAALAAAAWGVDLWLDTYEDVDRGYFVRHGLVDLRYAPRLGARVLRHLGRALERWSPGALESGRVDDRTDCRLIQARFGARLLALVLPGPRCTVRDLDALGADVQSPMALVDLASGAHSPVAVEPQGDRLHLATPLEADGPRLLIGEIVAGRSGGTG